MTDRDLAYWLQGFFELSEPDSINAANAACISRHLALVRTLTPDSAFATKIETLLMISSEAERATLIRKVVADLFEHVIDKEHPDQAAANATHHGHGWSASLPGHGVYRC